MTKTQKAGDLAFFVCGTPSDKGGFEYAALGPDSLPGNPSSYLDRRLDTREQCSYEIKNVLVGQSHVVMYAQTYPIKPNDTEINRGAYVSVGFVCSATPSLHTATIWIGHAGDIAAHLRAKLKPNNTFPKGFRLKKFQHESLRSDDLAHQCSPLLRADLLLQATHRTGTFEHLDSLSFGNRDFPADSDMSDHLRYTGEDSYAIQTLETERDRIAELAETAAQAAALAASEQKVWLAFHEGAHKKLEAFGERKTDFETVLEQLNKQLEAAYRVAGNGAASNRTNNVSPKNQAAHNDKPLRTSQSTRRKQSHSASISRNRTETSWSTGSDVIRKFGPNSAAIAIIVVSAALISTMVFLQNRTSEPTAISTITPQQQPATEVKPLFEDPLSASDIVRERAALDGPSQSSTDLVETEN